ncbi:hypothetical protein C4587_00780 [Candidatus Parcubacteria bacterium]|nr:MAG: hypothetical protein C4587_00780 [Candidatus Parcubacteria bacterium]
MAFPSFETKTDAFKGTLASYLKSVEGYGPEIVSEAALTATRKGGAWPPSAPEFYEMCNQVAARRFQRREAVARLTAPVEQFSDEHREAMKAMFRDLVSKMENGALEHPKNGFSNDDLANPNAIVNRRGQLPYTMRPGAPFGFQTPFAPYGFLTPAELAEPSVVMNSHRVRAPSWREKWDRMHGYAGWRDAAE